MSMISNKVHDSKIAHIFYRGLVPYISGIEQRRVAYKDREFWKFAKKLKNRWDNFCIKWAKRWIYSKAEAYGLKKRKLWKEYRKIYLQSIIERFNINIDRSFSQAQLAIERNLDIPSENKGFFGLKAVYSLRKRKLEKPGPVEGISRLTSRGRIFHIRLIPYVKLLIVTGQAEIIRRADEIVSYNVSHDLVWVDQHPCWLGPKADEVCNRWRNRIVSLNGVSPGFPKMSEARSEKPPLFHPNCTHSFHALTDGEAKSAINQGIMFYSQLTRLLGRT